MGRYRHSRMAVLVSAVAVVGVLVALYAWSTAVGREPGTTDPSPSVSQSDPSSESTATHVPYDQSAQSYWTEDRMRNAAPAEMPSPP